jgi:hypothetical protein
MARLCLQGFAAKPLISHVDPAETQSGEASLTRMVYA